MVTFSLVVVRHGATDANERGIIQGQSDYPLNDDGRRQALLLGRHFRQCQPFSSFTHSFSSDLSRAKETAEIILHVLQDGDAVVPRRSSQCGENGGKQFSIICDARLRERKYGVLEGETTAVHEERAKRSKEPPTEYTPEGGETVRQMYNRMSDFFVDLCQNIAATSWNSSYPSRGSIASMIPSPTPSERRESQSQIATSTNRSSRVQLPSKVSRTTSLVPLPEQGNVDLLPQLDIATSTPASNLLVVPEELLNAQENRQTTLAISRKSSSNTSIEGSQTITLDDPNQVDDGAVRPPSRNDFSPFASSRDSGISAVSDGSLTIDTRLAEVHAADGGDRTAKRSYSACSSPGYSPGPISPGDSIDVAGDETLSKTPVPSSALSMASQSWTFLCGGSTRTIGARKISVQSIASDDANFPDLDAQVLVVTHGGAIRELFRYFVEELGCLMVGGEAAALRPCPNTGYSSFMVNVNVDSDDPEPSAAIAGKSSVNLQKKNISVICLGLHSKEHLSPRPPTNFDPGLDRSDWLIKPSDTPPCDISDILTHSDDEKGPSNTPTAKSVATKDFTRKGKES